MNERIVIAAAAAGLAGLVLLLAGHVLWSLRVQRESARGGTR